MKKLWIILIGIYFFVCDSWVGRNGNFPSGSADTRQVVATDGTVLIGDGEVLDGQNVWQAMGGMQVGSIWGHGSYVAPDWTADYLHRESRFYLKHLVEQAILAKDYDALDSEQQAVLRQRLQDLMRTNTYDAATGTITVDPIRAKAFEDNLKHYSEVFTNGNKDYAIQRDAQSDPVKLRKLELVFLLDGVGFGGESSE